MRRLDRNGEGGYRLNGARCRLTDVIEVLSDTGLGKETHSVISQGRVDAIVTSKPRDRRLLIEEAAGLGKHRKRRRRAQLKLERTQENLDRALDVEREARSRLRPLKRQAEAAELHERLERQILQARWELARDASRARRDRAGAAPRRASREARAARAEIERTLQETIDAARRAPSARWPSAPSATTRSRGGVYEARSARERLALRAEQVGAERAGAGSADRARRARAGRRSRSRAGERRAGAAGGRAARAASRRCEAQLAEIEASREQEIERELAELQSALRRSRRERIEQAQAQPRRRARRASRPTSRPSRRASAWPRPSARPRTRGARRRGWAPSWRPQTSSCAATRASAASRPAPRRRSARSCGSQDGYELALAAALGGRLDAALVEDVAGRRGAARPRRPRRRQRAARRARTPAARRRQRRRRERPPAPGALRLIELLSGPPRCSSWRGGCWRTRGWSSASRSCPSDFSGHRRHARAGACWFAAWGEVRQLSEGGTERVLARRNERDRLIAAGRAGGAGRAGRARRLRAGAGGGARRRSRRASAPRSAARGRARARRGGRGSGAAPSG